MGASSCVAKYTVPLAAYNSLIKNKKLCEAIKDRTGIRMACPPPQDDLNALDRKVLCAIFCCCLDNPNTTSAGHKRYQNCVAATLRAAQTFDTNQPAYRMNPEVSYDMSRSPPQPLGRYADIEAARASSKAEYEAATGRRRPDVVVRRDNGPLQGDNIARVYEMKFPGDKYGPGQEDAYKKIASDENNLVTLDKEKCCDSGDDKEGESTLNASKEIMAQKGRDFLKMLAAGGLIGAGGWLGGLGGRIVGGLGGLTPAY